ncbi:hypothetical protein [Acinetobacter sp. c3-l95]|uniref:hypothetical protein n=1 Tax=Acinetobacter sp. c3-l95 TaxID=3342804 RepID=UPI0035B9EE79
MRKCSMYRDGVWLLKIDGLEYVSVGKDHFPNRPSAIKIDDKQPFYGKDGMFKENMKIIEQMQTGKVLYYRYREFPHDFNIDKSISLQGFDDAYQQFLKRYYEIP